MFAHDTFTAIFGTARPGELEILSGLVRAAVREGYAIVLNEPGTKKPLCPLNATQRRNADRMAQDDAAERGEVNAAHRRHACGIAHALTEQDAAKVTGLITRMTKAYDGVPNIGLEPGRSRLVAVDMDTAGQRDAFLATWEHEAPGTAPTPGTLYTVASPGQQSPDGTWAHRDGGHSWFTLPPGIVLPTGEAGRGVLTDDGGWSLIWSGLQVLVPPSVRAEGPYAAVGSPRPAPAWLLQRIETEVLLRQERERLRIERRTERVRSCDIDPVDAWSAETPWSALLEPQGWSPTGRVDTCSCPTWTAPGPHGSPKSATAHDEGCAKFDTDDGHAPLHIWTDNPPDYLVEAIRAGHRTLTKLTHEAYAGHEGDESATVIALGLAVSTAGPMVIDNPFDLDDPAPVHTLPTAGDKEPSPGLQAEADVQLLAGDDQVNNPESGLADTPEPSDRVNPDEFATPAHGDQSEPTTSAQPAPAKNVGTLLAYDSSDLDTLPDPDPLVYGLLDRGSVALLAGKFGTYKSFLALDWACHVALGLPWQGHDVDKAVPVVYIAAEGQVGVKRRVRGWRQRHLAGDHLPPRSLTVIPQRVVLETDKDGKATAHLRELVELVNDRGAGLVVFDTLSKSRGKAEENSNSDMAQVMALVIELCRATGATVLLVAHTGYSGEHTRGGSSQEDDADSVFVIKFEDPKNEDRSPENKRILHHRKSKDGLLSPPRVLTPRVEEIGRDDRGRAVTTLTLSADPFEMDDVAPAGPRGALSEMAALAWFEDQDPPSGMTRRTLTAWTSERGLKGRVQVIWAAYQQHQQNGSAEPEPDDQGNRE